MSIKDNSRIGASDSNAEKIPFCLTHTKITFNKSQNEKHVILMCFTRLFVHSFVRPCDTISLLSITQTRSNVSLFHD